MNYSTIVKQAWDIAWKRRYLWVFGFFAGMGGNTFGNIGGRGGSQQATRIAEWITENPALLGAIILGGLLLWCVLIALQSLSYASLILATGALTEGKPNDFDSSLDAGFRWFWRVFWMQLLLGMLVLALIAFAAVPPLLMIITKQTGLVVAGVAWLAVIILPAIAAAVSATIVWDYALRHAVLRDLTAGEAIAAGWSLFRANLGKSVITWLIMFAIGLAYGLALVIALVVFGIPFVVAGAFNPWLGIIPAVCIGLPVAVVLVSIYGVFDTAYWSGVFIELTRPPQPQPQPDALQEQPPVTGIA